MAKPSKALYSKSRFLGNFRLMCMGSSLQCRKIFMQLDLDDEIAS